MGEWRDLKRILLGKSEEIFHLGDPSVDGRILLRWILESEMKYVLNRDDLG
jgi:hypothetical protein